MRAGRLHDHGDEEAAFTGAGRAEVWRRRIGCGPRAGIWQRCAARSVCPGRRITGGATSSAASRLTTRSGSRTSSRRTPTDRNQCPGSVPETSIVRRSRAIRGADAGEADTFVFHRRAHQKPRSARHRSRSRFVQMNAYRVSRDQQLGRSPSGTPTTERTFRPCTRVQECTL
jgi:hypothetical protein